MIQDIFPLQLENQYRSKEPGEGSRLMIFYHNEILVKREGELDFLPYEALQAWCEKYGRSLPKMVYLFSVDERDYFLTELPEELLPCCTGEGAAASVSAEATGSVTTNATGDWKNEWDYEFVRMFAVRPRKPKEQVFAAATAWHLYVWYRDNCFCGRCGSRLEHSDKLRMLTCPDCDNRVFPKIAPAVIVGVTNGEYILMTKYANREYKRYALIAGFTEIGETAEETVAREVMEEVGLSVKNIRYYKSQPWGFDSNLLLGYFCELDDPEGLSSIKMDEEELAEAEWVHYSDVPDDPEGLSLTREMMTVFKKEFHK